MERQKGQPAKEQSREEEYAHVEDERTESKEEKGQAANHLFAPVGTEEDGDGIHTIRLVSGDVFEVFDGKGEEIGDEEIGNKGERK